MERLLNQNRAKPTRTRIKCAAALAVVTATAGCSSADNNKEGTPPPTLITAPTTQERAPLSKQATAYVCEGIYTTSVGHGKVRVIARPIISPKGYPMDVETSQAGLSIELPKKVDSSVPTQWYNLNGVATHREDHVACPERQVYARESVEPHGRVWVAATTPDGSLPNTLDMAAVRQGVANLDYGVITTAGLGQILDQASAIARAGQ